MLELPYGRVLVGVFGAVLAIVGVVIVVRSLLRKFEKNLRTERMSQPTRRIVAALGIIGGVACGVVAVATGLPVQPPGRGALRRRPGKGPGRDAALVR